MREYEVTIILVPNLEEAPRKELLERVLGWLTPGDDDAAKPVVHTWGKRRMAYEIRGFKEGFYVFYEAKLDPAQINELERSFQFAEEIMRYLVVRKEG